MITEEDVKRLEQECGRKCTAIRSKRKSANGEPLWEVVVRKAKRPEYQNHRAAVKRDDPAASETLFMMVCVYPPREALLALLDDFPAIPEACYTEVVTLAGIDAEESGNS